MILLWAAISIYWLARLVAWLDDRALARVATESQSRWACVKRRLAAATRAGRMRPLLGAQPPVGRAVLEALRPADVRTN